MESKMRTLAVGGAKTGIRLDEATWAAVDLVSERRGMKWHQWVREVLAANPDTDNKTGAVRAAAMQAMLDEATLQERADQLAEPEPLGFAITGQLSDDDLERVLSESRMEEGAGEYVGFTVRTGTDSEGRVFYVIENGVKGFPHVAIATPFTPEQWLHALEAQ
jgi:predicted DNA-binding ribbon-helix-helix protein